MDRRFHWKLPALVLCALAFTVTLGASAGPGNGATSVSHAATASCSVSGKGKNAAIRVGLVVDSGGLGDKSFNDAAWHGLQSAAATLGVTAKCLVPNAGGSNRQDLLTLLASTGFNPVIANGFNFESSIAAVAKQFPSTSFAIVSDNTDFHLPNVVSLGFSDAQYTFLSGVVAALKSKTHRVGFIGGVQLPALVTYAAGFQAGACYASQTFLHRQTAVFTKFLTQPPDFSGFNAPDLAKQAAQGLIDQKVDVIDHSSGGSGIGVFQAASQNRGVWAIGDVADQYVTVGAPLNRVIISSQVARLDVAVSAYVKSWVAGKRPSGLKFFNLRNGGETMATSGGKIDAILPQLKQATRAVVTGKLKLPTTPQPCS